MSMTPQSDNEAAAPVERGRFLGRRHSLQTPSEALEPVSAPPPPPAPPSKRRPGLSALSGFLSFLLVVAICAAGGVGYAERELREPGPLTSDKVVMIAPRTEVFEIISQLESEGVIDSPALLNAALIVRGDRSRVKAGEYLFKQHASLRDVIDTLVSGREILHSITLPEGLTSEQIVARLMDNDVLVGDVRETPKEGSLLPDTYRVARGMQRADLIRKMQDAQKKLLAQIWARRSPDLPLRSPYELVTLASIVEKETGKADERPRVAGVFLNRLGKRMRLQSDPTIVYGIVGGKGTLGRPILKSEVERATPYNTYAIEGLPPGPIANPGKAAMEAVANPSRTKDLYFVADGTGGHVFAETLDQHGRNVQRWRQIEKDMRERQAAPTPVDQAPADMLPSASTPPAAPGGPKGQRTEADDPGSAIFGALPHAMQPPASAPANPLAYVAPGLAHETPAALAALAASAPAAAPARPPAPLAKISLGPAVDARALASLTGFASPLDGPIDAEDGTSADMDTVAVSPARRAEQRARAARFGLNAGADELPPDTLDERPTQHASAVVSGAPKLVRIYDASEGKPFDPLKDKTWDLNSAKTVPDFGPPASVESPPKAVAATRPPTRSQRGR